MVHGAVIFPHSFVALYTVAILIHISNNYDLFVYIFVSRWSMHGFWIINFRNKTVKTLRLHEYTSVLKQDCAPDETLAYLHDKYQSCWLVKGSAIVLSTTMCPKFMFCTNARNGVCYYIEIRFFRCHKLLTVKTPQPQVHYIIDMVGKTMANSMQLPHHWLLNTAFEITSSMKKNHSIYTHLKVASALHCWPM